MSEPYGPFKPAYLTVKADRLNPWRKRAVGRPWRYEFPQGLGLTKVDWNNPWGMAGMSGPVRPTHVRLTFRDDWAAAEFALRYA